MIRIAICDDEKKILDEVAGYIRNYAEKKKGKILFAEEERIYAEQELDELIKDGWQILSSSTYTTDSSVMGSTIMLLTKLTIILHKPS